MYRRNVLCTARRDRKVNCILRAESIHEPNLRGDRVVYLCAAKRKKKKHEPCRSKEKEMRLSVYCSVKVEV